jgi:hypothetical protein
MKHLPGFVPVNFYLLGKILLMIGIIGLVLVGISKITGWFGLPQDVLPLSLVVIPVSLYLIFVVPKEK